MEEKEVEYRIVPDIDDMQDEYDALHMEMVSIRSELSRIRRAMDVNNAIEDRLIPLLSSMDAEGRVDIRPLLSTIAAENGDLRRNAEELSKALEDNKQRTRGAMQRVHHKAL